MNNSCQHAFFQCTFGSIAQFSGSDAEAVDFTGSSRKLLDMAFRVLILIQFYFTSGQVPRMRFHNLSPYCISLVLPDNISVTPKKLCSVQQINVARDQVQLSMILEIKCKDLVWLYF